MTACTPRYRRTMDARTSKRRLRLAPRCRTRSSRAAPSATGCLRRIALIAGVGIIIALPFALRAGAEFFLPVTAALVIAITLVPMLEWFERRGVPSKLAAALCVVFFLLLALFAVGSIVLPAIDWVALIPERIPKVRAALDPVLDLYKAFDRFVDRILSQVTVAPEQRPDGPHRNSEFAVGPACDLGAAPADPAVLRAAGDLLLPRRLDGDAEAHDRQPRQLRRRADDRAGDPAGRRRDLDLHRHDHAHQRDPGCADGAHPVAARAWIRRSCGAASSRC